MSAPDGIDVERVGAWLDAHVPGVAGPYRYTFVAGGRSNITYRVDPAEGPALVLRGPGIKTSHAFAAEPLPDDFAQRLRDNRELFPRGVDLVFVASEQIAALPRSLRVVEN